VCYVQWQGIIANNDVIVCTAQVLVNLLLKGEGYLSFDRISLLIFDECHRARKKDPYVAVMSFYDPARFDPLPKVFGMTVRGRRRGRGRGEGCRDHWRALTGQD
jgi:endoribonuclease Dicer